MHHIVYCVKKYTFDRALVLGTQPEEANKYVRVFAMIETGTAIENLEEILDVEGLDGVFVGPCDLSISLGVKPLMDLNHPTMLAAQKKVLDCCKKRNKELCSYQRQFLINMLHPTKGLFSGAEFCL